MKLLEHLSAIEPERIALKLPKRDIRFAEIVSVVGCLARSTVGRRIAINTRDVVETIVLLAAADGNAHSLALTSPSLEIAALEKLLTIFQPDVVLTDRNEVISVEGGTVPCMASSKELATLIPPIPGEAIATATEWIVTTSGTTATPKLVSHQFSGLVRTTRRDTERGRQQVWGLLYDFSRFAGLQVVLQSLLSGAALAVPDMTKPLAEQLAFLAEAGCTHLSATPTLWRKILMTPGGGNLALGQITLGGEIADSAVLNTLSKAFPEARLSHIFASTEAGVGFSVTDGMEGFPASYLVLSPSGIRLRIEDGRLHVKNDSVSSDYLGGDGNVSKNGWVDTGDVVERIGERVFFRGRANGVINVGGNKVHPEEVERVIVSHPDILMARVYARSNPISGSLVAADVVPRATADEAFRKNLTDYLKTHLERYMVPAILRITEPFETTPAGKINREPWKEKTF